MGSELTAYFQSRPVVVLIERDREGENKSTRTGDSLNFLCPLGETLHFDCGFGDVASIPGLLQSSPRYLLEAVAFCSFCWGVPPKVRFAFAVSM